MTLQISPGAKEVGLKCDSCGTKTEIPAEKYHLKKMLAIGWTMKMVNITPKHGRHNHYCPSCTNPEGVI